MGDALIVSVHRLRFMARLRERKLQAWLKDPAYNLKLRNADVPAWARGIRARKAGRFQWVVEATSWRGH